MRIKIILNYGISKNFSWYINIYRIPLKKNKTKTELFKIPDKTIIIISAVTLFELFAGAIDEQKWRDVKNLTDDLLIIPFDKEISEEAANIAIELRRKNKIIEFWIFLLLQQQL